MLRSCLEVTLVPHHMAAGPHLPPLSACLRGVVSLPRFRRRQLRGRISKDSGRRRQHGRASPAQGRWLAVEHTTQRRAPDDAIATGLKPDLLPRSGLCSPSPMAQAEPSMASDVSSSQSAWGRSLTSYLAAELLQRPGLSGLPGSSHSHPPSRSSSSSRYLSRVTVCGERPCR